MPFPPHTNTPPAPRRGSGTIAHVEVDLLRGVVRVVAAALRGGMASVYWVEVEVMGGAHAVATLRAAGADNVAESTAAGAVGGARVTRFMVRPKDESQPAVYEVQLSGGGWDAQQQDRRGAHHLDGVFLRAERAA